jgi:hypothetical protein
LVRTLEDTQGYQARYPEHITTRLTFRADSPRQAVEISLSNLKKCGLKDLERWEIDNESVQDEKNLTQALNSVNTEKEPFSAFFYLTPAIRLSLGEAREDGQYRLNLNGTISETATEQAIGNFLNLSAQFVQEMIKQGNFANDEVYIDRRSGGGYFAPEPPLVIAHTHLTVTTHEEVKSSYLIPQVFYDAWDEMQEINGLLVCTRALKCADNLEFKRKVYPHQWAMARAAKPGLTKYSMAMPSPEEMDFFQEGEPVLHEEGLYDPDQKIFEFSCALGTHDTEQHIPPWQIFMVLDAVDTRQAPSGEPADTIRVAFAFEAMARREARVLLDVGAKVIYLNARAEDEEITD